MYIAKVTKKMLSQPQKSNPKTIHHLVNGTLVQSFVAKTRRAEGSIRAAQAYCVYPVELTEANY